MYPKILYVKMYPESRHHGGSVVASGKLKEVGLDDDSIAVYQLLHIKKKTVRHDLDDIDVVY